MTIISQTNTRTPTCTARTVTHSSTHSHTHAHTHAHTEGKIRNVRLATWNVNGMRERGEGAVRIGRMRRSNVLLRLASGADVVLLRS